MTALSPQASPADVAAEPRVEAVRLVGVSKVIDERPILQDLNLSIPAGACIAILGANGAGKSTLLSLLATLSAPTAGELTLFGQPVARHAAALRARLGMIGHQPMLYRDLSAMENLLFFGRLYGAADPAARARALLAQVGLADRADHAARTFSRGMVQRLAIARALMHDPELLLADEPFSGLDLPSSQALERLLAELHLGGRTVLFTHHDIAQSLRLAQRVIVLRRGRVALDEPAQDLSAQRVAQEVAA